MQPKSAILLMVFVHHISGFELIPALALHRSSLRFMFNPANLLLSSSLYFFQCIFSPRSRSFNHLLPQHHLKISFAISSPTNPGMFSVLQPHRLFNTIRLAQLYLNSHSTICLLFLPWCRSLTYYRSIIHIQSLQSSLILTISIYPHLYRIPISGCK